MNRARLQLTLALFWFVSVYLAMGALLSWEWAWRCGLANLIGSSIAYHLLNIPR